MTSPHDQVLAKCGFDITAANDQSRVECKTMLRDMISRGQAQLYASNLARWQSERDMKVITALLDLCIRQNEALLSVQFDCDGIKTVQSVQAAIADFNKTLSEISALREVERDRAKEAATVDYLRKLVDEKQARIAELEELVPKFADTQPAIAAHTRHALTEQLTAANKRIEELGVIERQYWFQTEKQIPALKELRDAALAEVENYKAWNDRCGKLNSGLSDTVQELTAERDRLKAELDTIESPNMVNGKREIIRLNAEVNRLRAALEHVKLYGNRSSSEIAEEALGVSE